VREELLDEFNFLRPLLPEFDDAVLDTNGWGLLKQIYAAAYKQ